MRMIKAILCLMLLALAVSATAQNAVPNNTQGTAIQNVMVLGGWGSKVMMKIPIRDTLPVWANVSDSGRITIQPSTGILYWHTGTNWRTISAGTTYTAGYGLTLTGTQFKADTSVLVSKAFLTSVLGSYLLKSDSNLYATQSDILNFISWSDTISAIATKADLAAINPDLQDILTNGDSSGVGRIVIADYVNSDPVSGTNRYSTFVSRKTKTDPNEVSATIQLNDKWEINNTVIGPIYGVLSTPLFKITDSANSGIRFQGLVSNINIDSNYSVGFFKNAWMVSSGGHFGYPGSRVQHYAGYVAHNPVVNDTCDYCYGIKIAGFNATNFKNAIALTIGFVSEKPPGHWSIYTSQHIGYNNYFGSGRTLLGLPNDVEIDSNAKLQTPTITTTSLIKSTTDLSGSLTSLSYPQKVYVDGLQALDVKYTDTLNRLIVTKKYADSLQGLDVKYSDTAAMLSGYLLKNGWTMSSAGLLTAPTTGGLASSNGTLPIGANETATSSRTALQLNLSSTYTLSSGNTRGVNLFGNIVSTTGTAIDRGYTYSRTLNRTGTSSGIDAAFHAVPTFTAVVDFRGFWANYNNANSWGVYQDGVLTKNYFNGTSLFGSLTDNGTGAKLQITGTASLTSAPTYLTGGSTLLVRNSTTNLIESISTAGLIQAAFTIQNDITETPITTTGSWSPSGYYQNWRYVDATSGNVTLTVTPLFSGQVFTIKRLDNSGNTITVQMNSGNIDGVATYVYPNTANFSVDFIKNTTNTFVK